MQEADEQDTCRICSAPSEPDQPLFYPCKCSGTIRYIHQECLTTWLEHSHKKTCDVCKHAYSFTKVYATDMPARLPPTLLLRQLARQSLTTLLFGLRAILVGTVWLAILPWLTIWTWRAYFAAGDLTAWWISDRPRPFLNETVALNGTASINGTSSTTPPGSPWSYSYPTIARLPSDILAGQIITAILVLAFVTIFLLREWIAQHARPGVFEEDIGPEDIIPAPILDAAIAPLPNAAPLPVDIPPPPPLPLPAPADADERLRVIMKNREKAAAAAQETREIRGLPKRAVGRQPPAPVVPTAPLRLSKGKSKATDEDNESSRRQRIRIEEPSTPPVIEAAPIQDRAQVSKLAGEAAMRRLDKTAPIVNESYEFTFRPRNPPSEGEAGPSSVADTQSTDVSDVSIHITDSGTDMVPDDYDALWGDDWDASDVESEYSELSMPLGLGIKTTPFDQHAPPSFVHAPPPLPMPTRRPPLPVSDGQSQPTTPDTLGLHRGPSASPSLATYRPPEDLNGMASYFDVGMLDQDHTGSSIQPDRDFEPLTIEQSTHITPRQPFVDGVELNSDEENMAEMHLQYFAEPHDGAADDDVPALLDMGMDSDNMDDEADNDEPPPLEAIPLLDGAPPMPPALQQMMEANAIAQNEAEDMDANIEDDIDGAMEAIGMRGPIYGVLQNAVLMVFVLDTAIAIGIWIPFTIGKSAALLSLDPHRFLQIVHLPIRAMRIITDPVVDSFTFILNKFAMPPLIFIVQTLFSIIRYTAVHLAALFLGRSKALEWSSTLEGMASSSPSDVATPTLLEKAWEWASHAYTGPDDGPKPHIINQVFESNSTIVNLTEPHFAALGQEVRVGVTRLQGTWIRLALGYGPTEKVFAVLLGYAVVGVILAIYLNILTVGNVKSAGRAVRNAVRQQLLVFKVAVFILIELIAFPLGCGIMMDTCSIWLFPEANLQSRTMFFVHAPLTSTLYHWMAGTMFMYEFATMLSACRHIMRSGAMWFVKDPQDSNFHPIRDILDRPTFTQLRKLCISALLYSVVVAFGVGCVAGLLFLGNHSVLPLRWKTREPLSDVPLDLLFLHFVVPYTLSYFRPRRLADRIVRMLWRYMAAHLRISSYMFGGRYDAEEQSVPVMQFGRGDAVRSGGLRRVPNSDHVAIPKNVPSTIAVDQSGQPLTLAGAATMAAQNAEALRSKRNLATDYTVVYLPPQFRLRVGIFILLMWSILAIFCSTCIAMPIILGRRVFQLFTLNEVHDGYSFIAGFYALWGCYLLGAAIQAMDKRRYRVAVEGPRAHISLFLLKRSIRWLAATSYMVLALGVVIPILLALAVDFYLVLPIRLAIDPTLAINIRIVDAWALGLVYSRIAHFIMGFQAPNHVIAGLNTIASLGWMRPNPMLATTEVIAPVLGGLSVLLLFPAFVFWLACFITGLAVTGKELFAYVYPGIFIVVALGQCAVGMVDLLAIWSQSIRDSAFLVEMRLQNLEPAPKQQPLTPTEKLST